MLAHFVLKEAQRVTKNIIDNNVKLDELRFDFDAFEQRMGFMLFPSV